MTSSKRLSRSLNQLIKSDFMRTDAVERRKSALKHKVSAVIRKTLLNDHQIGHGFDDAELTVVSIRRRTENTEILIRKTVASRTFMNAFDRSEQSLAQSNRVRSISAEKLITNALSRSRSDTGKPLQRINQLRYGAWLFHSIRTAVSCRRLPC